MCSWPVNSTSVTNISSDSNKLSDGRPLIKQNIDNTNDIISEFDLASFTDGQILQYNNGQWQPVDSGSLGTLQIAHLASDLKFDPGGFISTDSAGNNTLADGSYFIQQVSPAPSGSQVTVGSQTSSEVVTITVSAKNSSPAHTTSGYFTVDSANAGDLTIPANVQYLIYKLD